MRRSRGRRPWRTVQRHISTICSLLTMLVVLTYSAVVVSQEMHNRVLRAQLLLPRLGGESVVDSHDVDTVNALGGESIGVLDVSGNLRGAWWSEGTWDADDDV